MVVVAGLGKTRGLRCFASLRMAAGFFWDACGMDWRGALSVRAAASWRRFVMLAGHDISCPYGEALGVGLGT